MTKETALALRRDLIVALSTDAYYYEDGDRKAVTADTPPDLPIVANLDGGAIRLSAADGTRGTYRVIFDTFTGESIDLTEFHFDTAVSVITRHLGAARTSNRKIA